MNSRLLQPGRILLIALLLSGCAEEAPVTEAQRIPERFSCAFEAGARPAETLGVDVLRGTDIKIDHFILLTLESRSFDHYFGALEAAGHLEVDGFPEDAANPDAQGQAVLPARAGSYCDEPLPNDWSSVHKQFNGGRNDGFVKTGGKPAMSYMTQDDLPFFYGLATTFAMADRFFSSMLGPSVPNRLFLVAATSAGGTDNRSNDFREPTIFDQLDEAGVTWEIYSDRPAAANVVGKPRSPLAKFITQAGNGTLPRVVYIEPGFADPQRNRARNSRNIQLVQQFTEKIYNAVIDSPLWPSIALIITAADHGGYYDHVPPPRACAPDAGTDETGRSGVAGDFDYYGFRVPLVVVSPWVRPGFVSDTQYDLTSVLRLIQARFDLPALTARDANATPVLDLFSFNRPRLLKPPVMPAARVNPERAAACRAVKVSDTN